MQSSNFGGFFTKDYGHTPGWNLMKFWYAIESDLYLWCSLSLKKLIYLSTIYYSCILCLAPCQVVSWVSPSTLPPWDRGYPWTKKLYKFSFQKKLLQLLVLFCCCSDQKAIRNTHITHFKCILFRRKVLTGITI